MSAIRTSRWKCVRRIGIVCSLACAANFTALTAGQQTLVRADLRAEKLESFFNTYGCPAPYHIDDYLKAADLNGIDYRLLPAVSVRESTCGLHARLNNRWGWDSARTGFESVARGIHFIAHELAFGRYYRGKSTEEKLHAYNPNPHYVSEVKRLMSQIETD
jgi:hypothetical protein